MPARASVIRRWPGAGFAPAGTIARLTSPLRDAPTTVPALGALALFVVWAGDQAGYPVTHWAPGALIMLALLAIALWSAPLNLRDVPIAIRVALACLGLYTLLSFLSILWAPVPGDAWEGANRTLLYLLVFALFALWPRSGRSAALLLAAWTLAMIALAVFVMLHLDTRASLTGFFTDGRLRYPAGYENANAATWAMAMWPALLLAGAREVPPVIRGALAGGIVLLADLALLTLSRGYLFATAAMLVLLFGLAPQRLRTFVLLVPVAAGIGASAPAVLRVGDRLRSGGDGLAALHGATVAIFVASALVAVAVTIAAVFEKRQSLTDRALAQIRRGVGAVAAVTLVVVIAGGWAAAGDPLARVQHAWRTFKSPRAYAANGHGNRLISGLGSERYDFYRVALDEFASHPLIGIGADNFQQEYLAHGRTEVTPHYPHSVELRTLAQTGLAGALIGFVGLAAALLASVRACRSSIGRGAGRLGSVVAIGALAGFAYWALHGSFDWFWEFAGLGGPAFALLGLTCALSPRRLGAQETESSAQPFSGAASERPRARAFSPGGRRLAIAGAVALALAGAASLTAPWLSQLQVQAAARIWTKAPRQAYARLDDAARLNPLSDEPYLLAGSIALRFGDLARARREFSLALARTSGDAYATLELGAIASTGGERPRALALLAKAVKLDPRDPVVRKALQAVRSGRPVSVYDLNRSILREAQQFA